MEPQGCPKCRFLSSLSIIRPPEKLSMKNALNYFALPLMMKKKSFTIFTLMLSNFLTFLLLNVKNSFLDINKPKSYSVHQLQVFQATLTFEIKVREPTQVEPIGCCNCGLISSLSNIRLPHKIANEKCS